MRARFVRSEWENSAHTIGSFFFEPDKPYHFTAGQYAELVVHHPAADDRGMTRTMTITSSPDDHLIRITTRFFPGKQSTYKQALLNLKPGDTATLTDAMGDLVLPLDPAIPLVFVAGGVGIASYVSMVEWLSAHHDARDLTLLYSVSRAGDIVFQQQFDDYAAIGTLRRVLFSNDTTKDSHNWTDERKTSRITSKDIMSVAKDNAQIYLSGSQHMVEQLNQELRGQFGVPQYRLAFDYFDGYVDC